MSVEAVGYRPLYSRLLRLRHVAPSGLLCFVFLEGAVALGVLLALAELVSWWGVLLLPALVAAMVKLNDVVAGVLIRSAPPLPARAMRPVAIPLGEQPTARLPRVMATGPRRSWAGRADIQQQRARQSAARRYE